MGDLFPSKTKKGKNEKRNSQEVERLKIENVELIDKILSLENENMRMENDVLSALQQEKRNSIRIQYFKETIKIFQSYANKHRICKHDCGKCHGTLYHENLLFLFILSFCFNDNDCL